MQTCHDPSSWVLPGESTIRHSTHYYHTGSKCSLAQSSYEQHENIAVIGMENNISKFNSNGKCCVGVCVEENSGAYDQFVLWKWTLQLGLTLFFFISEEGCRQLRCHYTRLAKTYAKLRSLSLRKSQYCYIEAGYSSRLLQGLLSNRAHGVHALLCSKRFQLFPVTSFSVGTASWSYFIHCCLSVAKSNASRFLVITAVNDLHS